MKSNMLLRAKRVFWVFGLVVWSAFWATRHPEPAQAYITRPVATLGQLCDSTYITVVRVENVSKDKDIIVYKKVKDIKGKYPQDLIRHGFHLKNTPQHKGPGDVPIRPDEKDWKYALQWAEPGKTAVMFTLKYDPYGDFGHTYIDGCWYATMCPRRDWDFWYSIYTDPTLLSQWHCGTPAELVSALELMAAKKEAIVPVMVGGTKEDLRLGKAKIKGLKVSLQIRDYNPKRDLVEGFLGKDTKVSQDAVKDERKKLEGTWRLIAAEQGGKTVDPGKFGRDNHWVFSGTDCVLNSGLRGAKGKFTIDPTKAPKWIDVTLAADSPGIYELKADTLRLLLVGPGEKRPTEFKTKESTQQAILTYQRVKAALDK